MYKNWLRAATVVTILVIAAIWVFPPVGIYFIAKIINQVFPTIDLKLFNTTFPDIRGLEEQHNCSKDFYGDEATGLCTPDCYTWRPFQTADDLILAASVVSLLISILIGIVSIMRAKAVFTFPSVLVVYMTISILYRAVIQLISSTQPHLLCPSRNSIEAITNSRVTPFCTIQGMVNMYGFFQHNIWWLCHAATLFWKVRFPLHARSFSLNKKDKYLHITCLLAGILLPLIALITPISDTALHYEPIHGTRALSGFGFGRVFQLSFCFPISKVAFGVTMVPFSFVISLTFSFSILVCFYIHKQFIFVKIRKSEKILKLNSSDVKLLILVCYYVIMYLLYWITSLVVLNSNSVDIISNVVDYLSCEGLGNDPNKPCNADIFGNSTILMYAIIALLLNGLSPAVHLLYVVNTQKIKERCQGSVWCPNRRKIFHIKDSK